MRTMSCRMLTLEVLSGTEAIVAMSFIQKSSWSSNAMVCGEIKKVFTSAFVYILRLVPHDTAKKSSQICFYNFQDKNALLLRVCSILTQYIRRQHCNYNMSCHTIASNMKLTPIQENKYILKNPIAKLLCENFP